VFTWMLGRWTGVQLAEDLASFSEELFLQQVDVRLWGGHTRMLASRPFFPCTMISS
jgi:hypothetical protein